VTEPLRPDAVLQAGASLAERAKPVLRQAGMALPNLAKLLTRLLRDPRVPMRPKLAVGGVMVYLVSPIDLIPEMVMPIVGQIDDLLLIAFALDRLVKAAGPSITAEHWDGDGDVLEIIRSVTEFSASLVPKRVRGLLEKLTG
jgi:uncharacterized membrane protein YkvA (DUF1232 family)